MEMGLAAKIRWNHDGYLNERDVDVAYLKGGGFATTSEALPVGVKAQLILMECGTIRGIPQAMWLPCVIESNELLNTGEFGHKLGLKQ